MVWGVFPDMLCFVFIVHGEISPLCSTSLVVCSGADKPCWQLFLVRGGFLLPFQTSHSCCFLFVQSWTLTCNLRVNLLAAVLNVFNLWIISLYNEGLVAFDYRHLPVTYPLYSYVSGKDVLVFSADKLSFSDVCKLNVRNLKNYDIIYNLKTTKH